MMRSAAFLYFLRSVFFGLFLFFLILYILHFFFQIFQNGLFLWFLKAGLDVGARVSTNPW